jgi:hypothetical protein
MTILLGLIRGRFAILAADRMHSRPGEEREEGGQLEGRKVVTHPTLPLAAALTGYATVRKGSRHRWVTDGLVDAFNRITKTSELTGQQVAGLIIEELGWRVARRAEKDMRRSGDAGELQVLLALMRDGKAQMWRLDMAEGQRLTRFGPAASGWLAYPASLKRYYGTGKYRGRSWLWADHIRGGIRLACHAQRVVLDGIVAEAEANGGENLLCGFGVDVGLVTAHEACIVSRIGRSEIAGAIRAAKHGVESQ